LGFIVTDVFLEKKSVLALSQRDMSWDRASGGDFLGKWVWVLLFWILRE
jgi:hypothetical protein